MQHKAALETRSMDTERRELLTTELLVFVLIKKIKKIKKINAEVVRGKRQSL